MCCCEPCFLCVVVGVGVVVVYLVCVVVYCGCCVYVA